MAHKGAWESNRSLPWYFLLIIAAGSSSNGARSSADALNPVTNNRAFLKQRSALLSRTLRGGDGANFDGSDELLMNDSDLDAYIDFLLAEADGKEATENPFQNHQAGGDSPKEEKDDADMTSEKVGETDVEELPKDFTADEDLPETDQHDEDTNAIGPIHSQNAENEVEAPIPETAEAVANQDDEVQLTSEVQVVANGDLAEASTSDIVAETVNLEPSIPTSIESDDVAMEPSSEIRHQEGEIPSTSMAESEDMDKDGTAATENETSTLSGWNCLFKPQEAAVETDGATCTERAETTEEIVVEEKLTIKDGTPETENESPKLFGWGRLFKRGVAVESDDPMAEPTDGSAVQEDSVEEGPKPSTISDVALQGIEKSQDSQASEGKIPEEMESGPTLRKRHSVWKKLKDIAVRNSEQLEAETETEMSPEGDPNRDYSKIYDKYYATESSPEDVTLPDASTDIENNEEDEPNKTGSMWKKSFAFLSRKPETEKKATAEVAAAVESTETQIDADVLTDKSSTPTREVLALLSAQRDEETSRMSEQANKPERAFVLSLDIPPVETPDERNDGIDGDRNSFEKDGASLVLSLDIPAMEDTKDVNEEVVSQTLEEGIQESTTVPLDVAAVESMQEVESQPTSQHADGESDESKVVLSLDIPNEEKVERVDKISVPDEKQEESNNDHIVLSLDTPVEETTDGEAKSWFGLRRAQKTREVVVKSEDEASSNEVTRVVLSLDLPMDAVEVQVSDEVSDHITEDSFSVEEYSDYDDTISSLQNGSFEADADTSMGYVGADAIDEYISSNIIEDDGPSSIIDEDELEHDVDTSIDDVGVSDDVDENISSDIVEDDVSSHIIGDEVDKKHDEEESQNDLPVTSNVSNTSESIIGLKKGGIELGLRIMILLGIFSREYLEVYVSPPFRELFDWAFQQKPPPLFRKDFKWTNMIGFRGGAAKPHGLGSIFLREYLKTYVSPPIRELFDWAFQQKPPPLFRQDFKLNNTIRFRGGAGKAVGLGSGKFQLGEEIEEIDLHAKSRTDEESDNETGPKVKSSAPKPKESASSQQQSEKAARNEQRTVIPKVRPNLIYRTLLRYGHAGHSVIMASVYSVEWIETYLPLLAYFVANVKLQVFGERKDFREEELYASQSTGFVDGTGSTVRGSSKKKAQTQKDDQRALDHLGKLGNASQARYYFVSHAFLRRHAIGPYAGETGIGVAAELADADARGGEEREEDWVVEALTRKEPIIERTSTAETSVGVSISSSGSTLGVGLEFGFGEKRKKSKRASISEVVLGSATRTKPRNPTQQRVSDRESGMVGRIRAAGANSLVGRSILGAYPGDVPPPDEAADPDGLLGLASRYGYGDWSDVDWSGDDSDNIDFGQRRKTQRRKRRSSALPMQEDEEMLPIPGLGDVLRETHSSRARKAKSATAPTRTNNDDFDLPSTTRKTIGKTRIRRRKKSRSTSPLKTLDEQRNILKSPRESSILKPASSSTSKSKSAVAGPAVEALKMRQKSSLDASSSSSSSSAVTGPALRLLEKKAKEKKPSTSVAGPSISSPKDSAAKAQPGVASSAIDALKKKQTPKSSILDPKED